jgi:putative DNA primase/helicase
MSFSDRDYALEELRPRAQPAGIQRPAQDTVLTENFTDVGNAHRFAFQHMRRLRYVEALGGWHAYDGRRWRRDDTGEVYRAWEETVRNIYTAAAAMPDRNDREQTAEWARKSENRARIDAAIALARYQPQLAARPGDFDANPWLLNLRNGTIDLKADQFRPHDRNDLITKLAPVTFEPAARAPTFEAFLARIFDNHQGLIRFVQRFVGHALTGLTTEQVLLLLLGAGANGKTTFVEILKALLGDYAMSADFGTFLARDSGAVRNDLARLVGARLVSACEMSSGGRLDEVVVKQITGGDTVTARFLFREAFEFRPAFKLILIANHKPRIVGSDHAIWRRIRLVPFEVVIPTEERDSRLVERIVTTELSGVLNWALEGCRQWRTAGLGEPEEVRAATESYRGEQDILAPFLADRCVQDADASVRTSDLYGGFKAWAEGAGEKVVSQRTLGAWLRERGFQSEHTKAGNVWRGLRVKGEGW